MLTGLFTYCMVTAFSNTLFKERQKEWKDQEQDKQLLDGLKGMKTNLCLKDELYRTFWSTPFGKGYGCVARQATQ